ncbi:amidase [Paenibacillus glycanilyticus]|uniref:Amidase n=1 Tax=Paenibacillus glycanilyticus TaxID=126569 RepID=A0ABQ6GGG2_9BACL|nr:amidase [Paenibacillus glycanilyticus]GLX70044.1 amidase [Paenibacillus glycanilyticus]
MIDTYNAFVKPELELPPVGEGLLSGLVFAVKDVFAIKGYTSGAGNPDWLRTHSPWEKTASSIKKLLASGARLTGTTHTDELMYSINGQNEHYGTPINPKAPDRIPGGSSSGSAVAVAAGAVDFALGTDTGGSVRVPSAYCGIYGFRPTHNLVAIDGVIPLAGSYDTVGWMARDSALLRKVGEVLLAGSGSEEEPRSFRRLMFAEEAWEKAEPSCRGMLDSSCDRLAQATGLKQEWRSIAPEGLEAWSHAFRTTQGREIWQTHGEWIGREKPVFGESIGARFASASNITDEEAQRDASLRRVIQSRLHELLGDDGLLVIPTIPGTAPSRTIHGPAVEERRFKTMQLSCIAGLSGLPQVTIPAGEIDGAPIGLSIIAGPRQDLKLLRLAELVDKEAVKP